MGRILVGSFLVVVAVAILVYTHHSPSQTAPSAAGLGKTPSSSCEETVGTSGASITTPKNGANVGQYPIIEGLASCSYVGNSTKVIEIAIQYGQIYYPEAEISSDNEVSFDNIDASGHWSAGGVKIGNPQDRSHGYQIVLFSTSASNATWIKQQRTNLQNSGAWDDHGIPLENLGEQLASEDVVRS
jgi:hypothetical protein